MKTKKQIKEWVLSKKEGTPAMTPMVPVDTSFLVLP